MIGYLQLHPHMRWLAGVVFALFVFGVGWLFHWWVLDVRYWFRPLRGILAGLRRNPPEYLPGQPWGMPAPLAGEHHCGECGHDLTPDNDHADWCSGRFHPTPDEWEQLDPDVAADVWVAELHEDLPAQAQVAPSTLRSASHSPLGGELDFDAFLTDCLNDLTLLAWDAKMQAARCRAIVEVGFPRLRAELGIAA